MFSVVISEVKFASVHVMKAGKVGVQLYSFLAYVVGVADWSD